MSCIGIMGPRQRTNQLAVHMVVEQPLTRDFLGRATCYVTGKEPIHFAWSEQRGLKVETSERGNQAVDLHPGTYYVHVRDADDGEAAVSFEVKTCLNEDHVIIQSYSVTHATTGTSHDGKVEAVGENLKGRTLLWTNGVETRGPTLHNASRGKYAAVPSGDTSCFVHTCGPAVVGVADLITTAAT